MVLRLAGRHAAVVFPSQTRGAAANAIADGIMPAPIVFLVSALEVHAIPMTNPMSITWSGPGRRGECKCGGGREEEHVSHSPILCGYLLTVPLPEMVTARCQ